MLLFFVLVKRLFSCITLIVPQKETLPKKKTDEEINQEWVHQNVFFFETLMTSSKFCDDIFNIQKIHVTCERKSPSWRRQWAAGQVNVLAKCKVKVFLYCYTSPSGNSHVVCISESLKINEFGERFQWIVCKPNAH